MNGKIYSVNAYDFSDKDSLFLDANIWLYIYTPLAPDDWRAIIYSKALQKIIRAKSKVFLDVLVFSEFINRYARLEYNRLDGAKRPSTFKNYRQSEIFKPVAKAIADACRRIVKHCECIESRFSSTNMEELLVDYEKECPDFNDQILTALCKNKGLTLITHDGDFGNRGLTLITANRRLLP